MRGVHIQRNGEIHGEILLVNISGIHRLRRHLLLVMFRNQGGDHHILLQLVGIGVNVVPHHKFVERKQAEHRLFDNVPFFLFDNCPTEIGEDHFHIHATLVLRKLFQNVKVDFEILF